MVPCCGGANLPLASLVPTFDKRQDLLETLEVGVLQADKGGLW